MYPYRVFLSYARPDVELVNRIAALLIDLGLEPLWDQQINPGTPFSDEIRSLISRAHVFMPILTEHSQNRAWVHQETGFAVALNIPVLPLSIGGLPTEMLSSIQAIVTDADLTGLEAKFRAFDFDHLVVPPPPKPYGIIEIADTPLDRAKLIANGAQWCSDTGKPSLVRVQSRIGVFGVPDLPSDHPIWKIREGSHERDAALRQWQREERRTLDRLVKLYGGRLIVDLNQRSADTDPLGWEAHKTRLLIFREFLLDIPPEKIEIANDRRGEDGSIVIIGDYFFAESRRRQARGYEHTSFVSHAPTVLRKIHQFDRIFDELPQKLTRDETVKLLEGLIAHGPSRL
ncbi:MAG: toll/interleukin-1 receptor domain-containing protein [Anaerolineae bacterium]